MEIRLWALGMVAALALAAGAAACSDGREGDRASVVPPGSGTPPTAVPEAAELVDESIELGQDEAAPNASEDSAHLFYAMTCVDDVLAITTTKETVYAELPCERALPPDIAGRFAGVPVRVRIVTTAPAKVYIESQTAGSAEFTVGRVWIEER